MTLHPGRQRPSFGPARMVRFYFRLPSTKTTRRSYMHYADRVPSQFSG